VPLAAAASRGECLECTRFLDRPTEQGCGVRTGAGGAGALAAGAALGTGEAAKAIAEALKSGKVVLTELNLFFRWSRGDCGRVAIGHVGADQAGKLSLSWNIFNWWCRVQAVREGEEPERGVWIV
jgi:hypothetical protein